MYRIDLAGKQFTRMKVIKYAQASKNGSMWICACDCGVVKIIRGSHLTNGKTLSCGCLGKYKIKVALTKHGQARVKKQTIEYKAWAKIKERCFVKKDKSYKNYGDRGITMCDRWKNSFVSFYYDMGPKPKDKHSIERVNNEGNYEPSNCIWGTKEEQANNTRKNVFLECNGKRMTISQWSRKTKISAGTITARIKTHNWSVHKALTTPVKDKTIEFNNEKLTISQWARKIGINPRTLDCRISRGWSIERAITTPLKVVR